MTECELSSHEKEEPYMHITKWKELIWKGHVLYVSNYMRA